MLGQARDGTTRAFALRETVLTFPVSRLNTAAAITVDCANDPNVSQPSMAVITAKTKGTHLPSLLPITRHSTRKTNLAAMHQTKEATDKRLHDGINDTFVLNACASGASGSIPNHGESSMMCGLRACARFAARRHTSPISWSNRSASTLVVYSIGRSDSDDWEVLGPIEICQEVKQQPALRLREMTMNPLRLPVIAMTLVLLGCVTPPKLDPQLQTIANDRLGLSSQGSVPAIRTCRAACLDRPLDRASDFIIRAVRFWHSVDPGVCHLSNRSVMDGRQKTRSEHTYFVPTHSGRWIRYRQCCRRRRVRRLGKARLRRCFVHVVRGRVGDPAPSLYRRASSASAASDLRRATRPSRSRCRGIS
jgi:hypothetical protein